MCFSYPASSVGGCTNFPKNVNCQKNVASAMFLIVLTLKGLDQAKIFKKNCDFILASQYDHRRELQFFLNFLCFLFTSQARYRD